MLLLLALLGQHLFTLEPPHILLVDNPLVESLEVLVLSCLDARHGREELRLADDLLVW